MKIFIKTISKTSDEIFKKAKSCIADPYTNNNHIMCKAKQKAPQQVW